MKLRCYVAVAREERSSCNQQRRPRGPGGQNRYFRHESDPHRHSTRTLFLGELGRPATLKLESILVLSESTGPDRQQQRQQGGAAGLTSPTYSMMNVFFLMRCSVRTPHPRPFSVLKMHRSNWMPFCTTRLGQAGLQLQRELHS
ncbi:hypothetical protein EYF80_055212 [Liparis tanakae]|uniref:Uncharacterized protein n=1 Tax=Liparis tanakae TaxID=230148 RepID=A0A4Z2F0Z7_9TELE|nr:hypothetical protein EYF80_055212 [Liparis tanakae]